MNLLHDISAGDKNELNVIIEVPRGSKNKYEIDKETGLIALDRAMKTAQDYPFDYGFVPQTHWHDDDALDVIVLTTFPLSPGILVRVRPVGLMKMIDGGDNDNKIISVPIEDPRWDHVQKLEDVPQYTLKEMEHFYSTYKKIEGKEVSVEGFRGREEAEQAIEEAKNLYKQRG